MPGPGRILPRLTPPPGGPQADMRGVPKDPAPDPALAATPPSGAREQPPVPDAPRAGPRGMGVVYLARNTLMDRLEVLKVLNKEMLERKGTYDRFLREVRAAARLSHANVVAPTRQFRSATCSSSRWSTSRDMTCRSW